MILPIANVKTESGLVQVYLPMRYRNNAPHKVIVPDVIGHLNRETPDWLMAEVILSYFGRNGYNTSKTIYIQRQEQ